jgi:hypothetical protein
MSKFFDAELAMYIGAFIVLMVLTVLLNVYVNKAKQKKCHEMGGTFVLNTSDSNQSTCILKGK